MKTKFEEEVGRYNKFQRAVLGKTETDNSAKDIDLKTYAKYLPKEGSVSDKRELLANLRSRLNYKDKKVALIEEA